MYFCHGRGAEDFHEELDQLAAQMGRRLTSSSLVLFARSSRLLRPPVSEWNQQPALEGWNSRASIVAARATEQPEDSSASSRKWPLGSWHESSTKSRHANVPKIVIGGRGGESKQANKGWLRPQIERHRAVDLQVMRKQTLAGAAV